jgi:hypothetical protein
MNFNDYLNNPNPLSKVLGEINQFFNKDEFEETEPTIIRDDKRDGKTTIARINEKGGKTYDTIKIPSEKQQELLESSKKIATILMHSVFPSQSVRNALMIYLENIDMRELIDRELQKQWS